MIDGVDLFSGAGGLDEGLRLVAPGLRLVGLDFDAAACRTRHAAGYPTIRTDVAAYPTAPFRGIRILTGGPPCQPFSNAGHGEGRRHIASIVTAAGLVVDGASPADALGEVRDLMLDKRSELVLEPLRWARDLRPECIVLEQVRNVLPIWQGFAKHLRAFGYSTWCGVLSAEQYGVPQDRKRAFLTASLTRRVHRPPETHNAYVKRLPYGNRYGDREGLFALTPWVSVSDVLGWTEDDALRSPQSVNGGGRASRRGGEPSLTVTGSWDGRARRTLVREVLGDDGEWAPADLPEWTRNRPATTLVATRGADVLAAPAWRGAGGLSRQEQPQSVRVTPEEAALLQSFRPDYPWQGNKPERYKQIGNAAPPLLAAHVFAAALGVPAPPPGARPWDGTWEGGA